MTATTMHKLSMEMVKISTGAEEIDALLGGGIETGSITNVFGPAATGKTQLCFKLAVQCQQKGSKGGAEGKCVFIDTTGTFKGERVAEIAVALGHNRQKVTNNIVTIQVQSVDQLFEALARAKLYMSKQR